MTTLTRPTDEWQDVGCGRHALSDQHQKHGHRQERRDAHRHLLSGVVRDVEAEQRDEGDE